MLLAFYSQELPQQTKPKKGPKRKVHEFRPFLWILVFFLRKTGTVHIELLFWNAPAKSSWTDFFGFGLPGPLLIQGSQRPLRRKLRKEVWKGFTEALGSGVKKARKRVEKWLYFKLFDSFELFWPGASRPLNPFSDFFSELSRKRLLWTLFFGEGQRCPKLGSTKQTKITGPPCRLASNLSSFLRQEVSVFDWPQDMSNGHSSHLICVRLKHYMGYFLDFFWGGYWSSYLCILRHLDLPVPNQWMFWKIQAVVVHNKTRFWGKSHQKVHPKVQQNLCDKVSLWYLLCPWHSASARWPI